MKKLSQFPSFGEFVMPTENTLKKFPEAVEPDMVCPICGEYVPDLDDDQYFMVNDKLWYDTCLDNNLSPFVVLCRDCFEKLLGRKLTLEDLTDVPVNKPLRKILKSR